MYLLRKVAKISAKFRFSEDNARFSDKPSAKAVLVLLSVRKSEFSEQNVSLLTIYQRTARTSSSDKFSFRRAENKINLGDNIAVVHILKILLLG